MLKKRSGIALFVPARYNIAYVCSQGQRYTHAGDRRGSRTAFCVCGENDFITQTLYMKLVYNVLLTFSPLIDAENAANVLVQMAKSPHVAGPRFRLSYRSTHIIMAISPRVEEIVAVQINVCSHRNFNARAFGLRPQQFQRHEAPNKMV